MEDKKRILAFRRLLREGKFERCEQLERLVRNEGIPERYRWMCWKALTGISDVYRPGTWERISRLAPHPKALEAMEKDLHRTFPGRDDFDETKQKMMSQICIAYAGLHPTIGYVQGMNFIVGFLLIISNSSEDVFYMFAQIMIRYSASLMFHFGLPLLKLYTYQFRTLLEQLFPDVHKHFEEQCVTPELYATKWFLTLFAHSLKASEEDESRPAASSSVMRVSRIWDYLLCDGLQAIVLVALATIKVLRPQLLRADTEGILELLTLRSPTYLLPNSGVVIKTALALKIAGHGPLRTYLPKMRSTWEEQNPTDAALLAQAEEVLRAFSLHSTVDSPPAEGTDNLAEGMSDARTEQAIFTNSAPETVACAPIATAEMDQALQRAACAPEEGPRHIASSSSQEVARHIAPSSSSSSRVMESSSTDMRGSVAEERCPDGVGFSNYAQGGVSDARLPRSSATAAPHWDPEDLEVQVTLATGRDKAELGQLQWRESSAGRCRSSSAEVPERLKELAEKGQAGAVRRSKSMDSMQAGTDHRLRPHETVQAPPRVMDERKEAESEAGGSGSVRGSCPSRHSRHSEATTQHDIEVRTTAGMPERSSGSGSRTATPTMMSPLPPNAMPRPLASPLQSAEFVPPDRHSPSCCAAQCPETSSFCHPLQREDTAGSAGNLSVESEGHMPSPPKATLWTSPGATREVSVDGESLQGSPHMSEACSRGDGLNDTVGALLDSGFPQTHPGYEQFPEGTGMMCKDPSTGALSDRLELSIGSLVAPGGLNKGSALSLHAQAKAAGFGKSVCPTTTFPMS